MSRWLHDGFFLRVVCLVLALITLTFTLILTNVFVDIDGIMTKQKDKQSNTILVKTEVHATDSHYRHAGRGQDDADVLKTRVEEGIFRTKRSLGATKGRDNSVKNKKMRDALTNRLVSLLEELDGDEPTTTEGQASTVTTQKPTTVTPPTEKPPNEDYKHLALHNILLKGIIDHLDVNVVYRKVHDMISKIVSVGGNTTVSEKKACKPDTYNSGENRDEDNIIDEMLNCKNLNQEVAGRELDKHNGRNKTNEKKAPQLLIKTIIDISNTGSDSMKNNTHVNNRENDNIKGIVNLLYNGRRVKFSQDSDEIRNVTPSPKLMRATTRRPVTYKSINKLTDEDADKRNKMLSKMMYGYYKHFQIPPNDVPVFSDILNNDQEKVERESKRPKRNIKVSHKTANMFNSKDDEKVKTLSKHLDKHDDDLYVEIETHFDDKGLIGEKKKKLIQNLIEKIENAINTNLNTSTENKPDPKNNIKKILKIRKRLQNSLDVENKQNSTVNSNKVRSLPETILERHINSINDPGNDIYDKQRRNHHTHGLFNSAKATNLAESREAAIDFNKLSQSNNIPQRLQDPLVLPDSNIYDVDLGDLKFVIKDIVGTGFVIGFSQYVDDIPDPENIKLFSNIEELFRTYHQNYDDDSAAELDDNEQNYTETADHSISKRNAILNNEESHNVNDRHRNEYKLIFAKDHFFPYNTYREIMHNTDKINIETKRQNDINEILTNRNPNVNSTLFQNIILNKVLKPSEILSIANLINRKRKKRYVNYKKLSQVRPKTVRRKINKYIKRKNTPVTKVIYRKPYRNKREARDKIRLIARDVDFPQDSNEDVVLFSDDESVLADRAIIKDSDMAAMGREMSDHQPEYVPYYDSRFHPDHVLRKFFDRVRNTHNRMMSKYPHLFVEEAPKSKELQDKPVYQDESMQERFNQQDSEMFFAHQEPHLQHGGLDLYPNIPKPEPNSNFKVTVKIMPKNSSDDTSGFREVHTSINKTFNKDGLAYVSLVNISEISKVEKVNSTGDNDCQHSTNHRSAAKEKEDRVKHLLRQKKDKITAQLKKLEIEKDTIEKMISHTTAKPATSSDLLSLVNGKLLDIDKEALANLLTDALKAKTQTVSTTSAATVAAVSPKKQIESPTKKVSRSQGNQDHALLVKLDKNTEVLEKILKTISLRSDQPPIQYVIHKDEKRDAETTVAPLIHDEPATAAQNNSYNIHLPYMYGNPYQNRNPIASVIYQGTVYNPGKPTNKVYPKNKKQSLKTPSPGIESKNQINAEMTHDDNNLNSIMLLNSVSPMKMNPAKSEFSSIKYKFSPASGLKITNNTGVFN